MFFRSSALTQLVATAACVGTSDTASAQSLEDVQIPATPLVLKSQGSFFVGGEQVQQTRAELGNLGPGGHVTINQMYVRYMVPPDADGNPPVVMVHGATLTGKTWETTPDGRIGWDEYFVRKGHPVYVPDQAGRGRSGFDQAIYNNVRGGSVAPARQPELLRFSDEGVWPNFRFGAKAGAAFPDSQFPIDAVDELAKQAVPDMNRGLPTPTPTIKALSDLAAQLQGAVLMGHSQSGSFPLEAALVAPAVTKALVLVEPGVCPASYTDDQIKKLATVPLLIVFGDHRGNPTGLPTLPTWQARFEACQALIGRLVAAGGQAQMLDPTARGIRGNSHMMMQDKNSLQIADLILQWLDERVGKRRRAKIEALSGEQIGIVTVAAFTASGDLPKLQIALNEALDAGFTVNEIKEVLVQMYAYAGFPRSLNGINAFNEVVKQRRQRGKNDLAGPEPNPLPTNKSRQELGAEIRTRLTGSSAVAEYARFVPVIDEFLRAHLFGDIFGRDNLDFRNREIATIAALATLGGVDPQLKSHFNVGMNVGLTGAQLRDIVDVIDARVGRMMAANATRVLDETLRGRPASPSAPSETLAQIRGTATAALEVLRGSESPQPASPANFTGKVTIQSPFRREAPSRIGGATVTFQAGARTAWHMHPLGQTLIVTSGTGWVQREGGPRQEIRERDIVWTPPGVKHWHGATTAQAMTHVAIAEALEGSQVAWMEHVSDREYRSSGVERAD